MSKKLKHAFTLVELVVVTMLLGVIMTAIVMIIRPTQKHYNNITNKAQEQNKCIPVTDVIDAELRYATAVKIIYTDKNGNTLNDGSVWDNVDSALYPNFFHLSNNHREMIGQFDARGYAEKGETASGNTVYSLINKGYFTDYDYQFSIAGINSAVGQQSLTLRIDVAPMLVTSNDVTLDEQRRHSFEETFKLINLRNKSSLGGKILDMAAATDNLQDYVNDANDEYGEIYIFYAVPRNVASSGGVASSMTHPSVADFDHAYDSLVPDLRINDPNEVDFATIHFIAGSTYTGNYKVTAHNPDDQMKDGNNFTLLSSGERRREINMNGSFDLRVDCAAEDGYIKIFATDVGELVENIRLDVFGEHPEIWVYDKRCYYTDPMAIPSDAHITTIHYMYVIGEEFRGLRFSNATADPHTVRINGSAPGFVACDGDRDIQVLLYDEESHVDVTPGVGTATNSRTFTVNSSSPSDIWVYNGVAYERSSDLPDREAPFVFHYLTDMYDQGHAFALSCEAPNNAMANGSLIGHPDLTYFRGDGSFDVVVNINPGVKLNVYNANGSFIGDVLSTNPQREYWVYDNDVHSSMPEVASFDHDIHVHYIHSDDPDDLGLRLYDIDTYAQSSQYNGVWIQDRNSGNADYYDNTPYMPISNQSLDFTVTIKHFDGRVKVMGVGRWGANSLNLALSGTSPSDIWIYKFNVYNSYEEVAPLLPENQPEPEPPQPGTLQITEYGIASSWVTAGQIKIVFSANGGDTTAKRVRITMANPITNPQNGWGSVNGGYESVDGNTIIYRVNPMAAGATGDLFAAFDSQDFSLVSVEIID